MWRANLIGFCLVGLLVNFCQAKLNLFLNQKEVRRLLGLTAELYYVREGVINEYALNFSVPVPAHIGELHFSWQSLADVPLPYTLDVNVSNPTVVPSPLLNISRSGSVPTKLQTFRLSLPCSGLASAQVDVVFTVNVSLSKTAKEPTSLVFRRKKICLKDENPAWNHIVDPEEVQPADASANPAAPSSEAPEVTRPTPHIFYIAIGCACGLIAALVSLAAALCLRRRNKRRQQRPIIGSMGVTGLGDSRHAASASFLQRVDTPDFQAANSNASSKSHSSCASFRRTPIYAVPIMTPAVQKTDHAHSYSISTLDSRVTLQSRDVKDKMAQLAVDRSKVKLHGVAMEGTFGRLLYAVYVDVAGIEQDVYVKTVTDQASSLQVSMMFQEGLTLHAMNHRHIQSVMALCQPDVGSSPMLIYPHDGFTNLKRFLQRYKNSSSSKSSLSLTTQSVVDMSLQLVLALQYLHRRKVIHKDIATRNCIVDEQLRVKLCDTALSRDLFPGDYHCLGDYENRPIKWMAVETIAQKDYSPASDVWMFGVLLWELTTLAQQPYLEVDPFEMAAYLRDGYRLAQPLNCPDELFAVMAYCWAMSPDDRPSLAQLHAYLHDFYSHLNRYV